MCGKTTTSRKGSKGKSKGSAGKAIGVDINISKTIFKI
jgi:hypothetical protein